MRPSGIRWLEWRTYRAMYRSRGAWQPSIGAFACLAVLLLSFVVCDPFARVVTRAWLGLILLTCVLCAVALAGASARAVRAILRLGVRGGSRPRWWFEWANLAWSLVVLVLLIAAPPCALAGKINMAPWGTWLFIAAKHAIAVLFCAFMAFAAAGYVVSALTRRPRIGNAYRCVQFVFPAVGGIALATITVIHWPAANAQFHWVPILVGVFSAAIAGWGVFASARTQDRRRTRGRPAAFD